VGWLPWGAGLRLASAFALLSARARGALLAVAATAAAVAPSSIDHRPRAAGGPLAALRSARREGESVQRQSSGGGGWSSVGVKAFHTCWQPAVPT